MIYGRIYKITNIVNNKIYIGQTIHTIKHRWNEHVCKSKTENTYLYKSMRKYGVNKFKIEQIDEAVDKQELDEKERNYIASFNSFVPYGYNISLGGGNNDNFTHNPNMEIIKQHMKESSIKRWKTMPEEERLKYVKRRLGKHLSDEVKKRIGEANKGRRLTEEQKKNISEGHKNLKTGFLCWYKDGKIIRRKECPGEGWIRGTPNGNDKVYYKQRRVRCIESNLIYSCLSEVERKLGFDRSYVGKSCKTGKACYGYHFEFIDGEPV